jgi:hypothetical protein
MFLAVNNIKKIQTFENVRMSQSTAPSEEQTKPTKIVTRKERWAEFKIRKEEAIDSYLK